MLGLLPTFVNPRTRFSQQMLEGLREIRACTSSIP